jgi:hypothetical protein
VSRENMDAVRKGLIAFARRDIDALARLSSPQIGSAWSYSAASTCAIGGWTWAAPAAHGFRRPARSR